MAAELVDAEVALVDGADDVTAVIRYFILFSNLISRSDNPEPQDSSSGNFIILLAIC